MDRRYKDLFTNMGLLTISNFASKILVFLLVPLYTSVLSSADYGLYDISHTTIELLFPLFTVCVFEGVLRFCLEKNAKHAEIISIGFIYWFVSAVLFSVTLLLLTKLSFLSQLQPYIVFIVLFYISYTFYQLMVNIAKGLNNVKSMAIGGVISTLCVVVFNILFLLCLNRGLIGFYIANILGQAVPAIIMFLYLRTYRVLTFPSDPILHRKMLSYSSPLILNTIGWWVNANTDKYVILLMSNVAINGLLGVAYKIPSVITVVSGIFKQAWQISAVIEKEDNRREDFYRANFVYFNAVISIAVSLLIILSPLLARLLFQKEFYNAWKFVPFLLCASMFNQGAGYIGPILQADMNSKAIAKSAIMGIVANVVLNVFFVKLMGPIGVTIATAISSYIIFFFREREIGPLLRWKNRLKISAVWLINILLACFCVWTKLYSVEILLILSVFIIFKEEMTRLMRLLKSFLRRTTK